MDSFSEEILNEIVSYVDSYQTLVSLLGTSRSLNGAASRPEVWNRLGELRWPLTWNKTVSSMITEPYIVENPKEKYEEQHVADSKLYSEIKSSSANTNNISHLTLTADKSYDFLLEEAMRSLGVKDNVYAKESSSLNPFRVSTKEEACIVVELFRSIHFQTITDRFHEVMVENPMNWTDAEVLEEGAILLSESLWTSSDLTETPAHKIDTIRGNLNHLGSELQSHMNEVLTTSTEQRASVAIAGLFGRFSGNETDYYHVRNSSIEHVLKSRQGIPITLAVIYKCILRRVGVHADVIGLPGHVVLGIPGNNYIDLLNGGQVLTLVDCRRIVESYGVLWDDRFLRPLAAYQIMIRMLNNILHCQSHLPLELRASGDTSLKTAVLLKILNEQMPRPIWSSRWPLTVGSDTIELVNRFFESHA